MTDQAEGNEQEQYAVIELFGRQRIAGRISEHNLGANFVRVDVPTINGRAGFTKLLGANAIYGITFVDRDVAYAVAEKLAVIPVSKYDMAAVTTEAVRNRLEHSNMSSHSEWDD